MTEKVKVELEIGKESKEVADAIGDLVADIKAGKEVAVIIAENIPGILKAIEGFEKLDDEMKDASRNATGAYVAYKVAEALAPVKNVEA